MSTPFYDLASLVVVPSGYKSGKIYAQKPLTTDGQLTFTRSNDTATRVGPDGLIEKVRTNLVLSSGDISTQSTYWGSNQSGVTTQNSAVAPDGTTTAALITPDGVNNYSGVNQTKTFTAVPQTYSVYLKTNSGTANVRVLATDPAGTFYGLTPITINTTWTRYTLTFTPAAGAGNIYITSSGSTAWLAWGAQLETGDIATDYIATTSAAVSVGPVANVPRLDYLGSSCPRLLLEPQRTNTMLNSERIGSWLFLAASATSNTAVSPSGYADADTATATGNSPHLIYQNLAFTSGTAYTLSVFAKANTSDYIQLVLAGQFSATNYANFDLSNGTITANAVSTAKIEDYGNGWYRCSVSATAPVSATNSQIVYLINSPTAPRGQSFSASGESVYLWGGQFEAGAYVTSYIPTLGAAVTRGTDFMYKASLGSSVFGTNDGVVFLETGQCYNNADTSATKDFISVEKDGSNWFGIGSGGSSAAPTIRFVTRIAGVVSTDAEPDGLSNAKIAIKYSAANFKIFVNGSLEATIAKSIGNYQDVYFMVNAADDLTMPLKQFLVFPTALSDADCIALTA
jgi:hypothetical protein